jgi:hypothetical protein
MNSVFQRRLATMSPAGQRSTSASAAPPDGVVRHTAPRDDFPLQGLTLSVRTDQILAIECPLLCSLRVLSGRAWITMDGSYRDVIAEPRDIVPIAADARTNVSALYDVVTVMIVVPGPVHDADFALRRLGNVRVLSIKTGRDRMSKIVQMLRAPVAMLGRRFAAATSSA